MNTDLEEALVETLRPRGDGPVDVTALRRAAVGQARSIRRRRLVTAGASLAAVTLVLGLIPLVRGGLPGGGSGGSVGGPGIDVRKGSMTLPLADAPGAAEKPAAVGTDPAVLHFDVDVTGMLATGATWSAGDGVESVRLWTSDFDHYNHEYRLATDPARLSSTPPPNAGRAAETRQVSVGGRSATARFWPDDRSVNKKPDVPTWSVDWQPVDGLWASVRLFTADVDEAVRAAEAMVLTRSQRCVAPLRLDPSLTGYKQVSCGVDFGHIFAWAASDTTLERPDGVRFDIAIGHLTLGDDKPFTPNRMVGNRPAMVTTEGGLTMIYVPITKDINLMVRPYKPAAYSQSPGTSSDGHTFIEGPAGLTDDELVAFAAEIIVGPDLTDPDTWPARP